MYIRKTIDEWHIQGYYFGTWETLTIEDSKKEAYTMLHCYNENEPNILHRVKKVRVKKERKQC